MKRFEDEMAQTITATFWYRPRGSKDRTRHLLLLSGSDSDELPFRPNALCDSKYLIFSYLDSFVKPISGFIITVLYVI